MFYYNVNEYNNLLIILIRHNTIRNIMVTYKKKPIDNKENCDFTLLFLVWSLYFEKDNNHDFNKITNNTSNTIICIYICCHSRQLSTD